jgi:hypothetical protein
MKSAIRNLSFKIAAMFGDKVADKFIRAGYFIKVSLWDKRNTTKYFSDPRLFEQHLIVIEKLNSSNINYLEFGVSKGWGLGRWLKNLTHKETKFFGFDTFTGIPEDWGSVKKGAYSAEGKLPEFNDQRCKFVVGLFEDTVPEFVSKFDFSSRTVINMDADLYCSTLIPLLHLQKHLKATDIIIFDEFYSVTKADHEFRAFIDFAKLFRLKYEVICRSPNQLAIKLV